MKEYSPFFSKFKIAQTQIQIKVFNWSCSYSFTCEKLTVVETVTFIFVFYALLRMWIWLVCTSSNSKGSPVSDGIFTDIEDSTIFYQYQYCPQYLVDLTPNMKMWICGEALTWNSTGTTIYSTYENGLDEIKIISHKKASTWYWKCLTTVARLLLNISHLWKQSREDTCSSEMKKKSN